MWEEAPSNLPMPTEYEAGARTAPELLPVAAGREWQVGDVVLDLYEVTGDPGRGRDGPRLPRAPPRLGRRPRGEDAAGGRAGGRRGRRQLRARGRDLGEPRPPSAHRVLLLRPPRRRRAARLRGVRGRRQPLRVDPRRAPARGRPDPRRRHPVRLGPALRARPGPRAPRREAGQPDADDGRRRQGDRLRPHARRVAMSAVAGGRGCRARRSWWRAASAARRRTCRPSSRRAAT